MKNNSTWVPFNCGLYADNYKCFRGQRAGFDRIALINLLIGKNNAGKSSLLDLVEYATPMPQSANARSITYQQKPLSKSTLIVSQVLPRSTFDTAVGNNDKANESLFEQLPAEIRFIWRQTTDQNSRLQIEIDHTTSCDQLTRLSGHPDAKKLLDAMTTALRLPFDGYMLFRLRSERDVAIENPDRNRTLDCHGAGLTALYEKYDNEKGVNPVLISRLITQGLNEIYGHDGSFPRIQVKSSTNDNRWEILVEEPQKGLIPLSDCGSGLKTVLMVLGYLYLLPDRTATPLEKCIFVFEEPENNLHPSLQRRLFKYLRDFAIKNRCIMFISTHSNVAIDIFAKCDEAQILHVMHDGEKAAVQSRSSADFGNVLDDLGFKASDILQSNFIVWVEGPSDRIYIRHGLRLTNPKLEEGVHYSIMFYGGRLLKHLSYEGESVVDEKLADDLIRLAKINRNAALILDSDRSHDESETLNATKARIVKEFEDNGLMAWVTWGREIENYIPDDIFLAAVHSVHGKAPELAPSRFSRITTLTGVDGKSISMDKVRIAREIENGASMDFHGDWKSQLDKLALRIRAANESQ